MFDQTTPTLKPPRPAAAMHDTRIIRLLQVLPHAGTHIAVGADAGIVAMRFKRRSMRGGVRLDTEKRPVCRPAVSRAGSV